MSAVLSPVGVGDAIDAASGTPPRPRSSTKRPRVIQLDVLRGVAVILVLGFHSPIDWADAGAFKPIAAAFTPIRLGRRRSVIRAQRFLVGGLLFEEVVRTGQLNIRRFLVCRTLMIWPLYYLFIAATIPLASLRMNSAAGAVKSVVPSLLFFGNYKVGSLGQMWSLSVEEHFYLLLPMVFFGGFGLARPPRHALHAVAIISLIAVIGVTTARSLYLWDKPFEPYSHIQRKHWRIDGLFFGVLLAYLCQFKVPLG